MTSKKTKLTKSNPCVTDVVKAYNGPLAIYVVNLIHLFNETFSINSMYAINPLANAIIPNAPRIRSQFLLCTVITRTRTSSAIVGETVWVFPITFVIPIMWNYILPNMFRIPRICTSTVVMGIILNSIKHSVW